MYTVYRVQAPTQGINAAFNNVPYAIPAGETNLASSPIIQRLDSGQYMISLNNVLITTPSFFETGWTTIINFNSGDGGNVVTSVVGFMNNFQNTYWPAISVISGVPSVVQMKFDNNNKISVAAASDMIALTMNISFNQIFTTN